VVEYRGEGEMALRSVGLLLIAALSLNSAQLRVKVKEEEIILPGSRSEVKEVIGVKEATGPRRRRWEGASSSPSPVLKPSAVTTTEPRMTVRAQRTLWE